MEYEGLGGSGGGYDAGGYDGGYDASETNAGYMQQPQYGGDSSQSSQNKGSGGRRPDVALPLTIRMINEASELQTSDFQFENQVFKRVVILGKVRSIDRQETTIRLQVEDGTGSLSVNKWVDGDGGDRLEHVQEGHYVRVYGEIRTYKNEKSINMYHIRVCQDFNELTHHFLEAIVVNTESHHGPFNKALQSTLQPQHGGTTENTGTAPQASFTSPQHSTAITIDEGSSGFTTAQQMVLNAIANDQGSETGKNMHDLVSELSQSGLSEAEVTTAMEFLHQVGRIYTTIDDFHWKAISDM